MHPLHQLLRKYEWVHLTLGLIGNTCFAAGSVLFLWESTKTLGTYLFIVGSTGMWVGSTGSAVVGYARHQGEHGHEQNDGRPSRGGRHDGRRHARHSTG